MPSLIHHLDGAVYACVGNTLSFRRPEMSQDVPDLPTYARLLCFTSLTLYGCMYGHYSTTCVYVQVGSTGVTMRSQKEITLKNDLDAKDRLDIYRNFLLYCMSGDVVALPMGSTGRTSCWTPVSALHNVWSVAYGRTSRQHSGTQEWLEASDQTIVK